MNEQDIYFAFRAVKDRFNSQDLKLNIIMIVMVYLVIKTW